LNLSHGTIHSRYWRWGAFFLLAIAFFLRFSYLLQIEHNVDHAYYIGQALRMLDLGEFPIVGQRTSLQFPNSAFLGYVYTPLLAFSRLTLVLYVFVIALNTLATYFVYRLGELFFHPLVGLVAMFFMTVNPWVIEYSRSTWSYSFLLFLLTLQALLMGRVLLARAKHPVRDTVLVGLLMTMTTLVTLTGYFIVPTTALIVLVFRKRFPIRGILWASVIFIVPTLIFIAGIIAQWQTTSGQLGTFLTASQGAYLRLDPLEHALRFISGADYELQRGLQAPMQDGEFRHSLTQISVVITCLFVVIGFLTLFIRRTYPLKWVRVWFVMIWFFTPILLMSYNSALIHPFYLLVTLPIGYVMAGYGVFSVWHFRPTRVVILATLGFSGLLMAVNSARYYQETQSIPSVHGISALSLEWGLPMGRELALQLPEQGTVYAEIEGWILNSFAIQYFPVVERVSLDERAIAPATGGVYVVLDESLYPLFDSTPSTVLRPSDGGYFALHTVEVSQWQPSDFLSYEVKGERWLSMLGYRVIQRGEETFLDSYWRVDDEDGTLNDKVYAPTAHQIGEDTPRIVVDGKPIAGYLWRVGDVHAYRIKLNEIPMKELSIGFYDGNAGEGLTFVLPSGEYTQLIPLNLESFDE